MAKLRVLPHVEADSESVVWGPWWVRLNGQRLLAEKRVDGWDYSTPITFELQPSVNADLVLESTGLASLSEIDVILLVESATTGHRFTLSRNLGALTEQGANILAIDVPPAKIARSVALTAHLVLSRSGDIRGDDVAYKHGARLAQSPRHTVWLEGDAPRFPTEAVAFSALGMEKALWDLDTSFNQLGDTFLSTVRLLVNTEHPAADYLLDETHAQFPMAHSTLEIDLVRRLILHVASDDELRNDLTKLDWDDGSVRSVLEGLTEVFFGADLTSIVELSRTDPRRFERRLQHHFNLFGGKL